MVWGLFPVDPLPGEHEYYIFGKGTYNVGRKGCDIIINRDKGVSRVHAEIVVDEMVCMDQLSKRKSSDSSKVIIRDCSKYGTFINKNLGSKEKVHEFPNKETMLKDGNLVSFGTGNATYRFSFVSLMVFAPSSIDQLQSTMSLIGASVTPTWNSKCTHVVVKDSILINDDIIDAIVAKKPIVGISWIELIAGKSICTESPSSLLHAPNLMVEGVSVKVTDPHSREQCLKGYTFLLQSIHKYKFKERLQLLLDVSSAEVVFLETQDPSKKNLGDNLVYVMPAISTNSSMSSEKFNSLPKVKETGLISAVVSGHLDPSIIESAPVLVTSSCSTDETVVADSDVEMETATSIPTSMAVNLTSAEDECLEKIAIKMESSENVMENVVHIVESSERDSGGNTNFLKSTAYVSEEFLPPNQLASSPDNSHQTAVNSDDVNGSWSRDRNEGIMSKKDKDDILKSENLDIIYSQNLIVRSHSLPKSDHSSSNGAGINFKRFRKRFAPSGNSFNNLVPFSEHPYEESDYRNEDVAESLKEEKRRKQMEAIAEDLFNNEGRKRGAAGSLVTLFARR